MFFAFRYTDMFFCMTLGLASANFEELRVFLINIITFAVFYVYGITGLLKQ